MGRSGRFQVASICWPDKFSQRLRSPPLRGIAIPWRHARLRWRLWPKPGNYQDDTDIFRGHGRRTTAGLGGIRQEINTSQSNGDGQVYLRIDAFETIWFTCCHFLSTKRRKPRHCWATSPANSTIPPFLLKRNSCGIGRIETQVQYRYVQQLPVVREPEESVPSILPLPFSSPKSCWMRKSWRWMDLKCSSPSWSNERLDQMDDERKVLPNDESAAHKSKYRWWEERRRIRPASRKESKVWKDLNAEHYILNLYFLFNCFPVLLLIFLQLWFEKFLIYRMLLIIISKQTMKLAQIYSKL